MLQTSDCLRLHIDEELVAGFGAKRQLMYKELGKQAK
jgi:hypothetical protein